MILKWGKSRLMDGLTRAGEPIFGRFAGRERGREKAQAPHPSNCSANYYAKIAEILATHYQLFWPTLYVELSSLISFFRCKKISLEAIHFMGSLRAMKVLQYKGRLISRKTSSYIKLASTGLNRVLVPGKSRTEHIFDIDTSRRPP